MTGSVVLQLVERWLPGIIESYDLTIYDRFGGECSQTGKDERKAFIEVVVVA